MKPTVTIQHDCAEQTRQLTADCPHAETRIIVIDGPQFPSDKELVSVLLDRHIREIPECRCKFVIYWPVPS